MSITRALPAHHQRITSEITSEHHQRITSASIHGKPF
jgi:hypothetical protein